MKDRFVVVDLETTGNMPDKGDRIIQISAVIIENRKLVDQFTSFVNPEIRIPPFIEELTGINDEMVAKAPLFIDIAPKIVKMLTNATFVAHNVEFDLYFLQQALRQANCSPLQLRKIDTVELAKIMLPTADSYKLTDLSEGFELIHDRPHQADSDALATAHLFLHFLTKMEKLPLVTLEKLNELSVYLKSDIHYLIGTVLQQKRSRVEDLPKNIEVFRGLALRKKQMYPQEVRYVENEYPADHDDKRQLFEKHVDHFEYREGQFAMMDDIYSSFANAKHILIEAGTGIGKSFGYLLPSIYFAKKFKTPVMVSTYTTLLQDQLLHKDIKILSKMIPFSFKAVNVKGRSHYLNLFKFEQTLIEQDHQYDTILTKMKMLVWLTETVTGAVDELNLSSGGKLFWNRVRHDGWYVTKEKDPWREYDFYLHARKKAKDADLIITNHAMLLHDLATDGAVLPNYDYVVIDEAHYLTHATRNHLGIQINYAQCKYNISHLGTLDKHGLFLQIEQLLHTYQIEPKESASHLENLIIQLDTEIDELYMLLGQLLKKHATGKKIPKIQLNNKETMKTKVREAIAMCAERALSFLKEIKEGMTDRLNRLKEKQDQLANNEKATLEEVFSFTMDWDSLITTFEQLLVKKDGNEIVWVEGDIRGLPNSIYIIGQPITVHEQLSTRLFAKKKSVVMTSATLAVNGSFQYFLDEVGLDDDDVIEKQIASPFSYEQQAKLIIPNDLPNIREVSMNEYVEAISNYIIAIASATKGRMLVLFTAHDMLKETYQMIKESNLLDDFILLAQGVSGGSNSRLTKKFQQFEKAILLGTNSFWDGIDIPGENLSCLVMVRLPFSPPNDPVTAAKHNYLQSIGKNPFTDESLPKAIIRFKQGFGRLLRRSSDRGIVIVFDRRIETTTYGKDFIRSLPSLPITHASISDVVDIIEDWL